MIRFRLFQLFVAASLLVIPVLSQAKAVPPGGDLPNQNTPPPEILIPFKVSRTSPSSGATNVPLPILIATFSRPVNPATVNNDTFKIRCNNEPVITHVEMTDEKTAKLSAAFFPLNASCQAKIVGKSKFILNTGDAYSKIVRDIYNNPLNSSYSWAFSTRPRNECQLEGCSDFYSGVTALEDTNFTKLVFPTGVGESITCVGVPKQYYQDNLKRLLLTCNPTLEIGTPWKNVMTSGGDWTEGAKGCPNPAGPEALGEYFFIASGPSCEETFKDEKSGTFDCQNSVVICFTTFHLNKWAAACDQNSCGN